MHGAGSGSRRAKARNTIPSPPARRADRVAQALAVEIIELSSLHGSHSSKIENSAARLRNHFAASALRV
jgi:hypothetical protein